MARKVRIDISKKLRKAREAKDLSLNQVIAKLEVLGIACSQSNLNRIELNQTTCRTDIFAGLCLILDLKSEEVLFK